MLLVIYGACTLIMVKASLYTGTPERQLEQYKSRNNILHDMLINENCLSERSVKSRREPAADERTDTQLEVEMRFYEELTTLLLECRMPVNVALGEIKEHPSLHLKLCKQ